MGTECNYMVSVQCVVENPSGLHARPAQELVKLSKQFKSSIRIKTTSKEIDAKSIFGLLSAAIKKGTCIEIMVNEEIALATIVNYISALKE